MGLLTRIYLGTEEDGSADELQVTRWKIWIQTTKSIRCLEKSSLARLGGMGEITEMRKHCTLDVRKMQLQAASFFFPFFFRRPILFSNSQSDMFECEAMGIPTIYYQLITS